jgi:hypothetical protein
VLTPASIAISFELIPRASATAFTHSLSVLECPLKRSLFVSAILHLLNEGLFLTDFMASNVKKP